SEVNMITFISIFLVILIIITIIKTAIIIPQMTVFVIEKLGKYNRTLSAGFHILVPFIEKIAYKHSLKEKTINVPEQICITKDNIPVAVDGFLYLQIVDPKKASYGINDYLYATTQLTQTTMRSIIGKLDLDQTFEERENINYQILRAIEIAAEPWGVKVNRYEIKDIKPPQTINDAMEKQMRAEREKRATIAKSEGERQSLINQAEGKAIEITTISEATATGLLIIAKAIKAEGGQNAVSLRLAEQYIKEFGKLAKTNNTMIIPSNLSDVSSLIASAASIYKNSDKKDLLETLAKKQEAIADKKNLLKK
ncbi:MAG: paraslipin, partial [Parachlamydiales bacterium]|nr:paraslipin [Parachlamydiales bacterium]